MITILYFLFLLLGVIKAIELLAAGLIHIATADERHLVEKNRERWL